MCKARSASRKDALSFAHLAAAAPPAPGAAACGDGSSAPPPPLNHLQPAPPAPAAPTARDVESPRPQQPHVGAATAPRRQCGSAKARAAAAAGAAGAGARAASSATHPSHRRQSPRSRLHTAQQEAAEGRVVAGTSGRCEAATRAGAERHVSMRAAAAAALGAPPASSSLSDSSLPTLRLPLAVESRQPWPSSSSSSAPNIPPSASSSARKGKRMKQGIHQPSSQ